MISRRTWIAAGVGGIGAALWARRPHQLVTSPRKVAVLKASSYSLNLENLIARGMAECGIDVRGLRVLVKPNLVEFSTTAPVHTEAAILASCVNALEAGGAQQVLIGEGPGHRRDTLGMAECAGYRQAVGNFEDRFTDLNLDDVSMVPDFAGQSPFYFPNTALRVDLIVSLAKMKTHHWAGATLSMKNLFGLVPGNVYGWPKNRLHFIGIDAAITNLYKAFPKTVGIVDGIVGMEGNGPIQGHSRRSGVVVVGRDLVAVDATCCRLMGINPEQLGYLSASVLQGSSAEGAILQVGEAWRPLRQNYDLIPSLRHLRLSNV